MSEDRTLIDPESAWPAPGLRSAEAVALRIRQQLRHARWERSRDIFQFAWGGDQGIILLVTPEAVEFRLPTVEWLDSHGCATSSRLHQRVLHRDLRGDRLAALIQDAQETRRREFRNCKYCGQRTAVEHRYDEDICHGCASQHLGIVY